MPKRPMKADDLLRLVFVGDPQISPDGERILFARKHVEADKNKTVTNLWSVDMQGVVAEWTQGEAGASHGRWSPDGHEIAFVSGREKPGSQIYLISTGGGEARKLSALPEGSVGDFKWSPDGLQIAFAFREEVETRTEKAKKEREAKGLSSPPWEIDSVWYRLDGDGYFGNQRYRLYLLDVATGKHRLLYDAAVDGNYSFDWKPDSKELAVIHTASKQPFADPPNMQIYRVGLDGKTSMLPGLPKGEKEQPRWSPDGQWIAYAGDVDETDPWGTRNTKLYVVAADGGKPRDLTGHEDFDLAASTLSDTREAGFGACLEWAPDSKGLYVQIGWHGESQLGFVDLAKGGTRLLTEGRHSISVGNVSRDGRRIAALWGDAVHLTEVAVIQPELVTGNPVPKVLTGFNVGFHDEIHLSEPEEMWLDSTDGTKVHTWVMKPIGFERLRYPAVLEIHGGPHAQYGWAFFHEFQLLAAEGYVVVYSNPRGSKGYGEAHCAAIRGNWGAKDWDDIQAVTHWIEQQTYVDPSRMGVMGGSYGGYMTNWVVGHSTSFRAAITDRCVSNMVSMAGNSDFPFNKDGYFKGVAWGDLEAIRELWRQSPIAYFDGVTTPMLIIHSEGDLRCNIEQSEEVFTALQQQGIESRFVRYPVSTSHGMSRSGPPDLRLHRLNEITTWWAKHLK